MIINYGNQIKKLYKSYICYSLTFTLKCIFKVAVREEQIICSYSKGSVNTKKLTVIN